MVKPITGLLLLLLLASCKSPPKSSAPHQALAHYPHDSGCYTQGLEFHGKQLLESGGGYGESSVRAVDPQSGEVLRQRAFPGTVFAEGLTVFNGELWLLTWNEQVAFVLDPETFALVRRHHYDGEGWGITHDATHLIMSNGSHELTFRDPKDFSVTRVLPVTEEGRPLDQLNELEWVEGEIFANIYTEDRIVRIDPVSGKVTGEIDLSSLRAQLPPQKVRPEELNGIAYDASTGHLWVTGKYWPLMFEMPFRDSP